MFSKFFINRPIFASVMSIIVTLAGGIAVFTLPIAQYPDITPPTVEVSAVYPGANAQVVADTVAAPIEQQVNGVENMLYMSSQCTNDGTYTLTVTFRIGVDLNMAQVLVQNRVALAEPILPDLVKRRGVTVKKKSPSILMIVNLYSPDESRDNLYLSNYATIQLRDELSRLPDVARIDLGAQAYDQTCTMDGKPSVALSIYQRPGSNALETARLVRLKMDELKGRFPQGLDYAIVYDTTPFITESVNEVFKTLRDAVILVAVVVLLFLQNWRSAVIPLIAVPVAIVGTFAVMAAFGFSLNNLTLFGLVLAIGIVVDDAIVVVEAVEHHIEHGMTPHDPTARAMSEVAG